MMQISASNAAIALMFLNGEIRACVRPPDFAASPSPAVIPRNGPAMSASRKRRGNGQDAANFTTPPASAPDVLTPAQAAALLCVSIRTLADWRLHNTGPAFVRLGHGPRANIRYRRVALDRYLHDNEQKTTHDTGRASRQ